MISKSFIAYMSLGLLCQAIGGEVDGAVVDVPVGIRGSYGIHFQTHDHLVDKEH